MVILDYIHQIPSKVSDSTKEIMFDEIGLSLNETGSSLSIYLRIISRVRWFYEYRENTRYISRRRRWALYLTNKPKTNDGVLFVNCAIRKI